MANPDNGFLSGIDAAIRDAAQSAGKGVKHASHLPHRDMQGRRIVDWINGRPVVGYKVHVAGRGGVRTPIFGVLKRDLSPAARRMVHQAGSAPRVAKNATVTHGPADTADHPNVGGAQPRHAGVQHLPKHNVPANSPAGHAHGGGGGLGPGGQVDFSSMLASLLGRSNTSKMIPTSLADEFASPDTALAATLKDQISRLPKAKAQALSDISDWFGQVQTAEHKGAQRDQSLADAGSASMQDAAKGIMASLGGSAMAGSGQVGAMGANDANTLQALGANDAMLADDLAPIFKASEASAKNTRSQQYDNQLSQLQDQRGQTLGQADADRAAALMQILGANNQSRQSNFGNASGLLNTLAGLQISGMNAMGQAQSRQLDNALKLKRLRDKSTNPTGLDAMTPSERASFVDQITQGIVAGKFSWPDALRMARNSARSAGLNPFGPRVIQGIIGPALSSAGITGDGGGFWPAIYKR